jgi:ABC-2 type transport system permease protein
MTNATLSHRAARSTRDRYSFRTVAQMEWRKLRTVRSTWYFVGLLAAGMIGLAMLAMTHEGYSQLSAPERASFDPVHDSIFTGLLLGQLLAGVLGVLTVTSEFASGMIRATFAAIPRRTLVLAAKAALLGAVMLAAGEIITFLAFFAGQVALQAPAPRAALGQPGVLRAVLLAGAYPALIALVGLGFGAIIRHTAGAICAVVAAEFLLPLLVAPLGTSVKDDVVRFLPEQIAALSLTVVRPAPPALSPGVAFALLCGYAAAALAAGAWALARRDA